ncbi:hypothetical protein FRB93_001362 [Tulasnella sp. JGI-2019a]|nr:hypothetical protein FRB93_001362 [Tulasnella sp. JGI-2019a]
MADKHGTKAENLATNFGYDGVATFLREWEIDHPPLPMTPPEVSRRSSHEGQPPSPQKSKKLHMKRSLENLLGRKPHGGPSLPSLSPLALDTSSTTPNYSAFNGSLTPATPEVYGSFAPSASRRPSLPHIFEKSPTQSNPSPLGSPSKSTFHRPLSASGMNPPIPEGEIPPVASSSSSLPMPPPQQPHAHSRLRSKISLLNIFSRKASTPTSTIAISPASYGASSPNLLAPTEGAGQNPVGTLSGGRPRSSIDEGRPSFSGSAYTRNSFERERAHPGTAPALQTTFQQRSTTAPQPIQPFTQYTVGRTSRSNSQPRPIMFDHLLRPRNDSIASSSSSFSYDSLSPIHRNPYAYPSTGTYQVVIKSSKKRDRSASEGASARLNRLMSETMNADWRSELKEEGVVVDDGGEGVEVEDVEAEERRDVLGGYRRPSESPEGTARRPSLPTGPGSGDSTGSTTLGHNRTSSTQSAKNLRFAELPPSPSAASSTHAIQQVMAPTSRPAPQRPLPNPNSPVGRAVRACVSLGSLHRRKDALATVFDGDVADTPDEEEAAVEAAEGADSLGELYDDVRSGGSGGGGGGRQTLMTTKLTVGNSIVSPTAATTSSAALFSPMTIDTPNEGERTYGALQQLGQPSASEENTNSGGLLKPSEADSRLRGASISSSKSTETTSTTTATSESSGGNTSISMGASTAKIGSNGTTGSVLSGTLRSSAGHMGIRRRSHTGYDGDEGGDSDSMSSAKEYGGGPGSAGRRHSTSPNSPIPIMLRNVNSHAQAHALVEKVEKDILSLAELPPNSAGLTGESLAAQLAAYGETLALERRFARGEKQRMVWLRDAEDEVGLGSDGDEEEVVKAFAPPGSTRRKSSGAGTAGDRSPLLKRAGSLEFDRAVAANANVGRNRSQTGGRGGKTHTPSRNTTSPNMLTNTVIRTTPSNVGPPVVDLNVKSVHHGGRHLNHLVLGSGIEITETLPTPTDSPRSTVESSTVGHGGGDMSGDIDPDDLYELTERAMSPENLDMAPLERVNTAPPPTSGEYTSTSHGRTASTGFPNEPKGTIGKKLGGGFRGFVQTLKGKS